MTYYCIYKDECNNKECRLRKISRRQSAFSGKDLCTSGFSCQHINLKYALLTSAERLVCKHYLRCHSKECLIKTNYFTIENFGRERSTLCPITNERLNLITEGNNSTCLSIWN